jgi:putative membrane protein
MFRYGPGFHHGPHVLAWLFFALLVAALVLGIVALVRSWNRPRRGLLGPYAPLHQHGPPPDPAVHELRTRYARGEVDRDEYLRRMSDLGYPIPDAGSPPPPAVPSPPIP